MTSSAPDVPPPTDETPPTDLPQNADEQHPESPAQLPPALGWTPYAEQLNGRFAMVGILILLFLNFLTHQDLFTWLGLR